MKKILVIAAHPDDEILGVGGTVKMLSNKGLDVRAVILGEGLTSRKDAREETHLEELEKLKNDARNSAKTVGYKSIDFCDLPDNRFDSLNLIEIIKCVSNFVEKYKPDTIFTHHQGDLNIDHQYTCKAVLTACRPVNANEVKRIYCFETPSSTEWNYSYDVPFTPNVYINITKTFDYKVKAMECYKTESAEFPHPRSNDALRALAQYRGSNVDCNMAEAFMLMREIINE